MSIEYSETADLFSMMDHVSGWWDGFTHPRYRSEWETRFGWSEDDQQWADRYREYRRRTYQGETQSGDIATSPNGLFASSETDSAGSDPLAAFMLAQPDIETALREFERSLGRKDAAMLRGFYNHFRPKWRELLAESRVLVPHAQALSALLEQANLQPFITRVSRFYQAPIDGEFRVLFTRFPTGTESSAAVIEGKTLLLHSPVNLAFDQGDWDTIVMHELVHYISSRQPDSAKRDMSDRFLARCSIPQGGQRYWMIEEPLAVAVGQAAYSHFVNGEPLNRKSNWYSVPWVDLIARSLEVSVIQALEAEVTLAETSIVEEATNRCRDLATLISPAS
ncbi:hypothetical protein [Erythrobacter sp. F6033]|uniref:hypothetical protein n=1 Tax=Erythrobacter sp. F6033 TaxID=2926401 RepID=UPI001FF406EE|nr:hypothetical protein [Erythrobacter sp. F6033]MCK0127820.1 hypothetical protein [Erythrobacter sp. F6033]